jgi:hypothetical protein
MIENNDNILAKGIVSKYGTLLDEPLYNAKVQITTLEGKPVFDASKNIGVTRTDFDGKFNLIVPSTNPSNKPLYITAFEPNGTKKSSIQLKNGIENYKIDLDFKQSQNLDEVVVIAKRSKPKEKKQSLWEKYKWLYISGIACVLILGGYYATKGKKQSK